MKIKSPKFITAGLIVLTTVALVTAVIPREALALIARAQNTSTTFVLNSSNKPSGATSEYSSFQEVVNDNVTLIYRNAKISDSGHVMLAAFGSIEKVQESRGLSSVTVTFEDGKYLSVVSSFDSSLDNGATYMRPYPTSGSTVNLYGNYWKVVAGNSEMRIDSVSLTYDCYTSASTPVSNSATISDFYAQDNKFVRSSVISNKHYLSVYCVTNSNYQNSYIIPSDLELFDNSYNKTASHIEYRDSTHFEAFFNLTEWGNEIISSSHLSQDLWLHMRLRNSNVTVYNSDGDVAHRSRYRIETATQTKEYLTSEIKEYDYTDRYMAGVRFSSTFSIASVASVSNPVLVRNDTTLYFEGNDHFVIQLVTSSGSTKNVDPSSFVVSSDENGTANRITADSVEVLGDRSGYGYYLLIKFSFIPIFDAGMTDYYVHLRVNGAIYDPNGEKGNLILKETIDNNTGTKQWKDWSPIYKNGTKQNKNMNYYSAWKMAVLGITDP